MDRDRLIRLLSGRGGPADACRRALADGAALIVWDKTVPARDLAGIYRVRQKTARASVQGFGETVAALESLGDHDICLGKVTADSPPLFFQLFLLGDQSAVVGVLEVVRSVREGA